MSGPHQGPFPIFLVRLELSVNLGVADDSIFRGFKIISRTDDVASWGRGGDDICKKKNVRALALGI